jgi:hypothetical protein
VPGQPRFAVGEQVVVFLERVPEIDSGEELAHAVLCMAAGAYLVQHDRATGELVLGRDLRGLTRVRLDGRPPARPSVARPLLLRDLAAEVRRARGQGGGR